MKLKDKFKKINQGIFSPEIEEINLIKKMCQGQVHMTMKMLSLNMAAEMILAMDLDPE